MLRIVTSKWRSPTPMQSTSIEHFHLLIHLNIYPFYFCFYPFYHYMFTSEMQTTCELEIPTVVKLLHWTIASRISLHLRRK